MADGINATITLDWTTLAAVDERAFIENRDQPCLCAKRGDRIVVVPFSPELRESCEGLIVAEAIRALRADD